MTIDEILKTVTVLKDETTDNSIAIPGIAFGLIAVGILTYLFVDQFYDLDIKGKILVIVLDLAVLAETLFGVWSYVKLPCFVDLYISTNGVPVDQITEYFEIDQLSEVEKMTLCRITPKSEYYDEIVEAYRTSIVKETEI